MTRAGTLFAIPNISEGRDQKILREIADLPGLLDVHSDPDHNRSVLTYGGPGPVIKDTCISMVGRAIARLDIGYHSGVHPRFGVVDVLPIVAGDGSGHETGALARSLAAELGARFSVPVHMYGPGDLPSLRRALRSTHPPIPYSGPQAPHPTAGVICLGVRGPMVAFNVDLLGGLEGARRVASAFRTGSAGKARALAFPLASRGLIQVSMNLLDPSTLGPAEAFASVQHLAGCEGLRVVDAELVGLVPEIASAGLAKLPLRRRPRTFEGALAEGRGWENADGG